MAFVIVGGGHAAGQAAASLRQEGYEGELVILADEPHIPYQRPPLSKQYLAGEQGLDRVYLRAEKFYADKDVDVRMAVRAAGIDRDARTVVLEDGRNVAYDKLLLATGARPRILDIPGADLPGIHYLRTIADSDAIKADMAPASGSRSSAGATSGSRSRPWPSRPGYRSPWSRWRSGFCSG